MKVSGFPVPPVAELIRLLDGPVTRQRMVIHGPVSYL